MNWNGLLHPDAHTAFRRIDHDGIGIERHGARSVLVIPPAALTLLAAEAFHNIAFYLRTAHLRQMAAILHDPAASENDRFVASGLLRNAVIAAEGVFPLCQDTGTANILAFKGENIFTGTDDAEALAQGVRHAWKHHALRHSQMAATTLFDECNTGTNLPAQIEILAQPGAEYHFLFIAKGGGSSNKTALFQETKALLNEVDFTRFLKKTIADLGVAACPPYHLAVVVGGTSPEYNLKMLKLATAGFLDALPPRGDGTGEPFRDLDWEHRALAIARKTGLGAQFGGRWLGLDARVIRLSRHAASCPVSLGVSCNAHRNARAKITSAGLWLETVEHDPASVLSQIPSDRLQAPKIDLTQPMNTIRQELSRHAAGTLLRLSGPLVVARDAAHARFYQRLKTGQGLPDYFRQHPICYAGPSETPPGRVVGSFGPTTAQRMDPYVPEFMAAGASLVMLAKGNRSPAITEACRAHGGFYLGTIGGAAALIAAEHIVTNEILDYADLGMEAVRRITVRDLPAFIICDDQGRNLYGSLIP